VGVAGGEAEEMSGQKARCEKGSRIIHADWCMRCEKNNIIRRHCDLINKEVERREAEYEGMVKR
jgi:hypothetical protein